MKVIKRKKFYYLGHSFRKNKVPTYREKYLGKEIPNNIEEIKEAFLRKCLQEEVFLKLNNIQNNFQNEWKRYPESIKKKNHIDLAIEFSYNTNAIEGSTITLEETEEIIKRKMAPNRPLDDIEETKRHVHLFLTSLNENKTLSLNIILEWHKYLFAETKKDIAGNIREHGIRVGQYVGPDWQDLNQLLNEFFSWLDTNKKIMHPIELSARAHYKFEKIHPFGDGNGRVGRVIIAHILRKNNFPILTIEYKKRKQYYHALTKSEEDFLLYFIRRYLSNFKKYL